MRRIKVHLDTDIGGDLDDLCALALLLNWPGGEITGLTTVLEERGRRAGYARYVLGLAGRADLPVAAGAEASGPSFRERYGLPPEARYWSEPVRPAPGPVGAALDLLKRSIERGRSSSASARSPTSRCSSGGSRACCGGLGSA